MPARKSLATKLRHGTARPDRARPQIAVAPGAPPAPAHLDPASRVIFDRLAQAMTQQGTATHGDIDALLLATSALADVARLDATLRDLGDTYERGGLIRPRPECVLRDQAWRRAALALRLLGLAPSARGQVEPVTPPASPDALEALLRRRERAQEASG
jgi:phage terminase small subunit